MKRKIAYCALSFITSLALGCGSASSNDTDAGPDDQPDAALNPDAPDTTGACAEFASPATTLSSYPATYNGDTGGAGADLHVEEGVCVDERTYYSNDGEDQVIELTNLTPGTEYVIAISSPTDLSFYVATGCENAAGGPTTGQCLLFVDEEFTSEAGDFVAPSSGSAMLVVDQYATDPADDASYTLEVYEAECETEAECEDPTPLCYERKCVGCITDFDCDDVAAPACDATNTCAAFDQCTGDDDGEDGNDGPVGAIELTPEAGSPDVVSGAICSAPAGEGDYFKITVAEGDNRGFALDWTGDEDLDLVLMDDEGGILASSYFNHPEGLRSDDMAAGTYYVYVSQWSPTDIAAAVEYTLTAALPVCDSNYDCNSPSNPVCSGAGICIDGYSGCTGDDNDNENNDDGPAGATTLSVSVGSSTSATGGICNVPSTERDYYEVNVNNGDNLTLTLAAESDTADLDLYAFNSNGDVLGFTWYSDPEVVTLTNLPAGIIYIEVSLFSESDVAANEAYTLTVDRANTGGCSNAADCAAEFETQRYRGNCSGSACRFIEGNGALDDGDACDSYDDCSSEMCSYVGFQSDADKSVCTVGCSSDDDCTTALGSGYACTVPFQTNFCHPSCSVDTDCGANTGSGTLDEGLPWDYLTCTVATGVCEL